MTEGGLWVKIGRLIFVQDKGVLALFSTSTQKTLDGSAVKAILKVLAPREEK